VEKFIEEIKGPQLSRYDIQKVGVFFQAVLFGNFSQFVNRGIAFGLKTDEKRF
jgi:hypothetical protein